MSTPTEPLSEMYRETVEEMLKQDMLPPDVVERVKELLEEDPTEALQVALDARRGRPNRSSDMD